MAILPSCILVELTEPVANLSVVTAALAIFVEVTAPTAMDVVLSFSAAVTSPVSALR
ncbi:MAG: hypothetical protein LBC48_03805 [Dysgonamonadaceae bacterium]|nr:hypothetical protein [Dysgonamonadaceae bacterium]